MRLRRGIIIAGGLLLVYSIIVIFSTGSGAKDTTIQGASDSSGQKGTMALTDTLRSCKIRAAVWEHPPVLLPGQSSTLLSIEPETSAYPIKQAQSVLDYAASGHHVIWVTDKQDNVLTSLGVKIHTSIGPSPQNERMITGPNIPSGIQSISFSSNVTIVALPKKSGILRYQDNNMQTFGAVIPIGTGDMTVWVVPDVFENHGIGIDNNFAIPWALINQSPLLIDEYGHGVEQGTLFQTIFGHGRKISFIFLVISAVLYLWSACVRLGSPKQASDDRPRQSGELLDALAWHFAKRPLHKDMLVIASKGIKKRICKLLSCHPSSDWQLIDVYVDKLLNKDIQGVYHSWRLATDSISNFGSRKLKKYNELTRKLVSALDATKKNE